MKLEPHGFLTHSLDEIFNWLNESVLALPELQRPSVWGDSKIPRLLSSIYNNYPIGILLLWEPKENERIRCRSFKTKKLEELYDPQKTAEYYLVDGQQRITALYRSLYGLPVPEKQVLFNVIEEDFQLENKKYSAKDGWYPLGKLLKFSLAEWTAFGKENQQINIDELRAKLERLQPNHIEITSFNVKHKPYSEVAEIFERINLGVPVKKSQIVLGKLSTVFPGIVENVERHLVAMKQIHGNDFDLDLLMSILAVTVTGKTEVEYLEDVYLTENHKGAKKRAPEQIGKDVDAAIDAVGKAFCFINDYLHIDTMSYFPSERTLACLAYLQSKQPNYVENKSNAQKLALWVVWALLSKRHGDQRDLKADLKTISENNNIAEELISHYNETDIEKRLEDLGDMDSPISRQNVLFGFLYGMVRWQKAKSFPSGKQINTTKNKNEKLHEHHIYPVAQIEREKKADGKRWKEEEIYDIANFTWLLHEDNEKLQDPNISYLLDYKEYMPAHLIDVSKHYKAGDYGLFLQSRREMICKVLKDFISDLKSKVAI